MNKNLKFIRLFFLSVLLSINTFSQKKLPVNSNPRIDWQELDSIKNEVGDSNKNLTLIERKINNDHLAKKKSKLAEIFLNKYPNDKHFQEVIDMFFHSTFQPEFLKNTISDSISSRINQLHSQLRETKSQEFRNSLLRKIKRSIPIDYNALNQWLQTGNEIAKNILESNNSLESKMNVELKILKRDIGLTLEQYVSLPQINDTKEVDFWNQFDEYYWKPYILRLKVLLKKYSNLEGIASYIQSFIDYVSNYSPSLKEPYWKEFLQMTNDSNELSNQLAFKELRKIAEVNLAAIEFLKVVDPTKPLEMIITDLEGNKIDLANLRGKVVLLDFWSIRCGPCIQEMPHVQALYGKYRKHGFEVIGLAADGDAAKDFILKILEKTKASWPQSLDKSKEATVSYHSLFNISSLPTVWLLDKEGKVVDKEARGKRLEPLIRKYLGLKKTKFDYKNPSFN